MRRFAFLLAFGFLALTGVSAAPLPVPPEGFYTRPGLERMPRVDYRSLPVVNVRDCGARGDGAQAENDAFDKAVQTLMARGGGVLFIPRGDYLFRAPTHPNRSYWRAENLRNIHFLGEGEDTVFHFRTPTPLDGHRTNGRPYCWQLSRAENVTLRGVRFAVSPYLDMRWEPGHGPYLLGISHGKNVVVSDVTMDNGGTGMVFWTCSDSFVVDCRVYNTSSDGIHFKNGKRVVAAYNRVENSGDDGIACVTMRLNEPPDETGSQDNHFLYNTVIGVRWGRGICAGGAGMRVVGNWLERTPFPGIFLNSRGEDGQAASGFPAARVEIIDNTVVRSDLASQPASRLAGHRYDGGIKLGQSARGAIIRGNSVFAGQVDGIRVGAPENFIGEDVVITGNTLEGNLGHGLGVLLRDSSNIKGLRVEENRLIGNGKGSATFEGALEGVTLARNEATQAPTAKSPAFPDASSGFQVKEQPGAFRDDYREARLAPDETAPEPAPSLAALAGLPAVSVRDLGAKGDGRTDDTPAFARAIARLPESGGVLRVPAGTYLLRPAPDADTLAGTRIRHHLLLYGRKNLHLVGEKGKTTLLFASSDHQGLRWVNVTGGSVRDLRLQLQRRPAARHNRALLDLSACTGMVVDGVEVAGSGGPGIQVDSSRQVLLRGCAVQNANTNGIHLVSSRQVTVEGCRINDSGDSGIFLSWTGSIARESQYVRLTGNRIGGTRYGFGIAVASGNQVEITGNEISDTYQAGVLIYQHARPFPPRTVRVTGNSLTRCNGGEETYTGGAISLLNQFGKEGDFEITGNRLIESPRHAVWVSGVMEQIARLNVKDNRAEKVSGEALHFARAVERERVRELVAE